MDTAIAAASWFFKRALGWPNPIDPIVEAIAANALWLVVALAVLAVTAARIPQARLKDAIN